MTHLTIDHDRGKVSPRPNGGRKPRRPRRGRAGLTRWSPQLGRRRSRLLTRGLPIVLLALVAFGFGLYEAGGAGRAERGVVQRYLEAWARHDTATMYAMLSTASQARLTRAEFGAKLAKEADVATLTKLTPGSHFTIRHDVAEVPVTLQTHIFGTLQETLHLRLQGDGAHVTYERSLLFPGLRGSESLSRTVSIGARGTILAADGTPLAEGPDRTSPIPTVANEIVGTLGPIPQGQQAYYADLGYPADAQVGQDGLELIFQKQLAGTPGGTLLAGKRVLAAVAPVPGRTVHSTIDPKLEQAAMTAIGNSYAGMTILNEHTGAVEAAVGLAFTDLQPPGSTFKIITTVAALQDHVATPSTVYPYQSQTSVGGYQMQNAGGESCGGTLLNAFATSCDTTFAPLGIQVGGPALVRTAERFGFNQPLGIPSALESRIPKDIGNDTAVGSTAIGQGQLEASTLEIADVGAAIANGGKRPIPTMDADAKPRYVNATTPRVASEVQKMMEAVVSYGTGKTAAIPGVTVAGKTGTAELANTGGQQNDVQDTDAWFVGYAPHSRAPIVGAALFPANGYGADSAAPAVSSVLSAALAR